MTINDLFLAQLEHLNATAPEPIQLLPSRLAVCCFEVLPIAAAAISVFTPDGFRFPIGASSPRAAYAERLQFTTGEGPSLDLTSNGSCILAGGAEVLRCWPQFRESLVGETSYRAIAAFPLVSAGHVWASVDLYFGSDADLEKLPVSDALTVVTLVQSALLDVIGTGDPWIDNPISAARLVTLSAIDTIMAAKGIAAKVALAALRAAATASGMTIDALANGIVSGRTAMDELQLHLDDQARSVSSELQNAS